jgi:hypothetical protein
MSYARVCAFTLSFVLLSIAAASQAALVRHNLVLQAERVLFLEQCIPQPNSFGCDVRPGDIFIGHFDVDDSLLTREGNWIAARVFNFYLQVGDAIYDQNRRCHPFDPCTGGSDFASFRGPKLIDDGEPGWDFSLDSIGFNVHGGRITAIAGGVYSWDEYPFIDFYSPPLVAEKQFVGAGNIGIYGNYFVGRSAQAIPEPAPLALMFVAMAVAVLTVTSSFRRRST